MTNLERTGRFDGIQVLRFVAAAMVVVTHSTFYTFERLDPAAQVWKAGEAGVDIFFVISGFVMMIAGRDASGNWVDWKDFAARRAIRLLPMYWVATTLNLLILLAIPALVLHSDLNIEQIIKSYILIPDRNAEGRVEPLVGVGWTLYFESFFYLLFAIALAFRIHPLKFITPILVIFSIIGLFRQLYWPSVTVYFNPLVLEFLFGMAIAKFASRIAMIPIGVAMLMLFAGFVCLVFELSGSGSGLLSRSLPATVVVVATVALEPRLPKQGLGWLVYLGGASYTLYLFHPLVAPAAPVILKLAGLNLSWLSNSLGVAGSIVFAAIAYSVIERPLLIWTSKFWSNIKTRSLGAAK